MRDLDDQIADIIAGKKTASEIIAEGVDEYALEYAEPATIAECKIFRELRTAKKAADAAKAKTAPKMPEMVHCACGHTIPRMTLYLSPVNLPD